MKIGLIQPYHPSNVRLYGKIYMSQLTLPALAALTPREIDVVVRDENTAKIDFDEGFDLVGISALTATATRAYEIADEFRKRDVPVVIGGVHASLMPQEAIEHADAVVVGEAEGVWEKVIEDIKKDSLKRFYTRQDKPDLTCLPFARHDLMDTKKYVNIPKVETSRGCPFNCSFCSTTTLFGRKMRYRKISDVVCEIKRIKPKFVFFTDNNIIGNSKYAKELFKALIPLKIKWISQASIDFVRDSELLKLARKSGCVGMLIGFESLSQKVLEKTGKVTNKVDEYKRSLRKLHRNRIGTIGCFVFGFDDEDSSVFERTLKFVKRYNIDNPQFTVLTPFPGTTLRTEMEKGGRILHNKWEKYDSTTLVFEPKLLPPVEYRRAFDYICNKVYSWPSIIKRILRSALYMRSLYRPFVFLQINIIYRKLFKVSVESQDPLSGMTYSDTKNDN